MAAIRSELKKRASAVFRLERKIEASISEVETPGFALNQWGSYDHEETRAKVLRAYRELIAEAPDEEYFRYVYAAALARARMFADAIATYESIASGDGPYSPSALMMLPLVHWYSGDRTAAQSALDRYNAPFLEKGIEPRHRRVEDMFAPK